MEERRIIKAIWFSSRGTVGIVKVKTEFDGIKYFIGQGLGYSEENDMEYIADWGAKCDPRTIAEFFSN